MHPRLYLPVAATAVAAFLAPPAAHAVTTIFFNSSQVATPVESGPTFDTVSSEGYLFTYTLDKFSAVPRLTPVVWPEGVMAQAVIAGPAPGKPAITIARVDRQVFDVHAFTARLLANTVGAGGSIEVMPLLDGEDMLNDPVMFDATGLYGQSYHYALPGTALLRGADAYKFTLYVDFALTGLTLVDASPPPVPEPATPALLLVGLGLMGLALRRNAGAPAGGQRGA